MCCTAAIYEVEKYWWLVSAPSVCTHAGHSGYVTVAAWFAYRSFQLSLLLSIPPSVINISLSSSYPVLNLSTWYFSWSVWTLGKTVWVISMCLIFDVQSLRKWCRASSRKGFLQAQTSTTSRILNPRRKAGVMGVSVEMMPEWPIIKVSQEHSYSDILRANRAHQGSGNAVCHGWRTLSLNKQRYIRFVVPVGYVLLFRFTNIPFPQRQQFLT